MQALLGFAALILNLAGYFPYIRDILQKKVKPHPYTWAIWTILTFIVAFNQIENGGGYSNLFLISTTILVGFVFILSLRFGMEGASAIDRTCLLLAAFLLFYWLISKDTHFSTIYAVIIDCFGAIPTLIKTYHHPKTETYTVWLLAALAGLLTAFSVPRLDWILFIYPLYVFFMDGAVVAIKYLREKST